MSKQNQTQQKKESEQSQEKSIAVEAEMGLETAVFNPTSVLQRAYTDPDTITPNDARVLQRTIGNQAVRRFIQRAAIQRAAAQRQENDDELQMKPSSTLEGGDVSSNIEGQIQNAKGGGRPLSPNTQASMGRAFNADFSSVKVHTGNQSDSLNRSISARAFTTGQDIFFRSGEYSPDSSSGQELLAHELTHTIQQGAAPQVQAKHASDKTTGLIRAEIQRSSTTIQRWNPFGKKEKPEAEDENIQWVNNPAYEGGGDIGSAQGEMSQQGAPQDTPQEPAWQGHAGQTPTVAAEVAKPAAAIMIPGASAAAAAGSAGGDFAAPVGAGTLGVLQMGDNALGLYNAHSMNAEANQFNDKGMRNLAGRKAKDQSAGLAMAAVTTARGGANIASGANMASAGNVAQAGSTAAGVAGGALGIVGGSAMVIQGAWRGGKAVMKLCRLTWGRGKEMLSSAGERWKTVIMNAEKFKLAVNALKIAAGILGIAAGALIIVSNPVGWAVGLAAAIAGGIYAGAKIAGKIQNARDKNASKKKLASQGYKETVASSDMEIEENWDMAEYRTKRHMARPRGATVSSGGGTGFQEEAAAPEMQVEENWDMAEYRTKRHMARPRGVSVDSSQAPEKDDETKRNEAIEMANAVARDASKNARVAGEMISALSVGNKDAVASALNAKAENPEVNLADMLVAPADQSLHDAVQLLSAINVDPDEALSGSGQDLIEKKLSKAEAM